MKALTQKQQKVLTILAVPVIYVIALVLFVRLTFPYETLRNRVLAEFNGSQKEKRLEIDEMSGSWMFGIEAEGVRLLELPTALPEGQDLPEGQEPTKPLMLAVESASVSVSALSYLFGTLEVAFEAEIGDGSAQGVFTQNAEGATIEVAGEAIDISNLTLLSAGIGLPLGGEMSGTVELALPEGLMKKAEGAFALQIANLTAGDGKAKIRNTIALPQLKAGNLVFKAEAAEGRLDILEFSADGPDFELDAEGKLRLREPFDKSSVSVNASFKFKEAYTNKSDLTRGIFGSPDSKIPALFDMDPMVRKAKKPDGSYSWEVSGLLSRPSFKPGRKTVSSSSAKAGPADNVDDEVDAE